jgi:hypothetical protein
MTATAFSDERIRRRLWIVLITYEALIIALVAGAGLNIALMGGGSIAMAAPLLLISCAEALRIPLSALALGRPIARGRRPPGDRNRLRRGTRGCL